MSASALSSATAPNRSPLERADQHLLSSSACRLSIGQGICRLDKDSFGRCMGLLTIEELSRSCLVSTSWRLFIDTANGQFLWKNASIREGVPVVEGKDRNYKDEFKFLRPITIGGRTIARYLGEIVGEVPRMREDRFLELRDSSDFFEPARFKRETHVVLVDPAALKITTGLNRPLALDESRTLVEVPEAERTKIVPEELTVPFSFKNLKALAKYPLAGMENGPVFNQTSVGAVFDQCNAPSNQNGILIMRKEVVARNTPFNGDHGQNAQVTNNRSWKVMTVRQRGFYDAIKILETGTCPDSQDPFTYVRTAERVARFGATDYPAAIGGFAPGVGVDVNVNGDAFAYPGVGLVPVGPAEVLRPLELGCTTPVGDTAPAPSAT